MAIRRTTVAAEHDDLAVLESEAQRLRAEARPRFGIVRGDGRATRAIADDEHAPSRHRGRDAP